jgi:hypothetical protein
MHALAYDYDLGRMPMHSPPECHLVFPTSDYLHLFVTTQDMLQPAGKRGI